ncbi:MAG: hypothetical protein J7M19_10055 [Planctomycetes bacterium]|nr:hypothetical protein [Planctomycetota bacterium]
MSSLPVPEPLPDVPSPGDGAGDAPVPVLPHPGKLSLNQVIGKESILELTLNVGNADDVTQAISSLGAICLIYESSADYHAWVVPRLMRVRRLLEEGRAHREEVVPVLRDVLERSIDGWPAAWSEHARRLREEGSYGSKDTDAWIQCTWRVRAGTYLLAELDDYDSLPLLARAYGLDEREFGGPNGIPVGQMAPCSPGVLLPMMHKLICRYPEGRLSGEAAGLRSRYIEEAKGYMYDWPYEQLRVLKWNALYEEADPRLLMFDPKWESIKSEPATTMTLYPWMFKGGGWISDLIFGTSDKATSLYNEAVLFINAAYPDEALPLPAAKIENDPSS